MPDLPRAYTEFREQYPEIAAAYDALGSAAHDGGPLNVKARQLAKLALAVGGRLEGAVKGHARRALEMGVSREEIMHVALLAITTCGFPTAVAAYTWIKAALDER